MTTHDSGPDQPTGSADAWGIDPGFHDAMGKWRPTSDETRAAIMTAMRADPASPPDDESPVRVLRAGQPVALDGPAELTLEDGSILRLESETPPDLPTGYHDLRSLATGQFTRLIVSPGRCHLPPDLRIWGWAAQLYAARSTESWGIGDLADLRRLACWSAGELGARLLLVNPLHAATPILPQQPSPYYPSSRRYRNPLYLRVEEAPGAAEAIADLEPLATAGRALNAERRIDRDAVFQLKMTALETIWGRVEDDPEFARYRAEQGADLDQFAVFCALAEHFDRGWRDWPEEFRHPATPAVARFAAERASRVRFHMWLQWLLDRQLAQAAAALPVMQDLPIGMDPTGADVWAWQESLALGARVGAPPDEFNTRGQDWGLPPFVPHALRAAGYEPFIQTIRATLRHAGGLRIDHVMGLFRLYWIPEGLDARQGAYVRYPAEDLLAIVALESQRAGAFVVGEDLGTVEPAMRESLADHAILSYRLLWFEPDRPARYPRQALAAITTHDLPTVAGLWSGGDLQAQREIGVEPNEESTQGIMDRLLDMTSLTADTPVDDVVVATHQLLAEAPSMALTATLDDALAVEERPNMPGTTTEWPNWSIALPLPLEEIERHPLPRAVAKSLADLA